MNTKLRDCLCSGLLVAVSFFLYAACRNSAFIWDDQFLVVKNPLIRSPVLAFEAFRHFLGEEPASNFYRPVQALTYLLDYWRAGLDSAAFHDGSCLIHGLNASLLFLFVRGLLRREEAVSPLTATLTGLLVALLWLAHPIHSATVAYIAGRADSLALLFLLAGWCLWDFRTTASGWSKWMADGAVFVCGFLAACSKEAAFVGIGVFLFTILFSKKSTRNEKIGVSAGIAGLLGLYFALRFSIAPGEASQATGSLGNRTTLVLRALGDYCRLLFFPGNLRMERQVTMVPNLFRDPATYDPLYSHLAILGGFFLAFLLFSVLKRGPRQNLRRFGVLWFTASILPVSNLFVLNATVAEHWLYIPSVGFLLLLAGWTLEMPPRLQKWIAVFALLAVVALSIRTKKRAEDWISPITFFESTIQAGGDTARMRVNLANEYQLRGNPQKGEKLLRSVLALNPFYAQARHALVINLKIQGRIDEANQLFAKEERPFGKSFRGQLYTVERMTADGKFEQAAGVLKKMRAASPDSWLVIQQMGFLLVQMGRPSEKLLLYKNFAENHWWHAASRIELAKLYESEQKLGEAIAEYLSAARLDSRDVASRSRAQELSRLGPGK